MTWCQIKAAENVCSYNRMEVNWNSVKEFRETHVGAKALKTATSVTGCVPD